MKQIIMSKYKEYIERKINMSKYGLTEERYNQLISQLPHTRDFSHELGS